MPSRLSPSRPSLVALALGLVLALAGCTGGGSGPGPTTDQESESSEPPAAAAADVDGVRVLPGSDAGTLALDASRALFASSPVVVVVADGSTTGDAEDDGEEGSDPAPSVAVASAAADVVAGPVLVVDGTVTHDDLAAELERLGTTAAVVVRPDASDTATADPAASGTATPEDPATSGTTTPEDPVEELLGDLETVRVDPTDVMSDDAAVDDDALADALADLPETGEPRRSTGVLALTDPAAAPASAAAEATARASGASLLAVPGGDPRASAETVQGVHDAQTADGYRATVGIGSTFGTDDDLSWRVATAATGVELPAGGQLTLPGKRYVALYGAPGVASLGVLGEQDVDATIARAKKLAAQYEDLSDEPVVPTLEIITTVAAGAAGDDGNYSNERPADLARPYVDAAREAGVYVVLDFQPGRTDFPTQVKQYEDLVLEPNVGVALDPEWRLGKDEKHLEQIGHVDVDEVNAVGDYLAGLVRDNDLPQKTFLLHQFRTSMIAGRERLDTGHPELAVVIHADGQGGQEAKQATWRTLHHGAPDGVYWGWKNFYDEDAPMLTPEQTMRVEPTPDFISYQ
ncbi:hypothetical protein [Cellulosimicrobium arenosum]|uniref:Lipoprotein n=1 Tax=Cellulosimicrobium arenosum TaxID=2708133 RepID=A0A927G9P1_9MICO|nr:hypothetical protein [Cellulosimicrobium arenosum]MBD8079002.1 hypothetical protein [Cellulosimicrobium arenosum]